MPCTERRRRRAVATPSRPRRSHLGGRPASRRPPRQRGALQLRVTRWRKDLRAVFLKDSARLRARRRGRIVILLGFHGRQSVFVNPRGRPRASDAAPACRPQGRPWRRPPARSADRSHASSSLTAVVATTTTSRALSTRLLAPSSDFIVSSCFSGAGVPTAPTRRAPGRAAARSPRRAGRSTCTPSRP